MESEASSSTPQNNHRRRRDPTQPQPWFKPTQPVADRIARALRHRLLLLHRYDSSFFVLGATGNVYTVALSATPSCTCPDRTTPCKHILFVFIRVLGVPLGDVCLRRRTLRPCQLSRLLDTPTLPESLARASLREKFHQLYFRANRGESRSEIGEIEEGTTCPICLDEVEKGQRIAACATCRNLIHEECLVRWKRSRGRRSASCVICRARWQDRTDQDKYLNLAAYVAEEDVGEDGGSTAGLCAG
ncbi:hypothetical protein SLE2022_036340 [Rubroshorea leprosula]